ncbi:hypothetical protein RMB13_14310 [Acinetobacter sp. V102_4]|uniref:hypothetical protein n=1 Tax=Acinetobacter sp. V102_4 TaxID=3072984 RepID=UPI00287DA62B|nr:hypothetical protein [Acinetobacter sp. V102_4]MDS7930623.1 hypothetical protein [Acinetobacter sp. V102_4]
MCYSNNFWSWVGCNAGQIQILIAVIALLLAIIPIRHAYKQFKLSNAQRAFELKMNLYRLTNENIVEITKTYEKYSKLISEYEYVNSILLEKGDPDASTISNSLENLKDQKKELFKQIEGLDQFGISLSNTNFSNLDELEDKINLSIKILVQSAINNVGSLNIEDSFRAVKKVKNIS